VTRSEKALLARFTVRLFFTIESWAQSPCIPPLTGALNWATGETVAVKEIQLSNIPKGELGEIMVSGTDRRVVPNVQCSL
jgi:hypothetical protein